MASDRFDAVIVNCQGLYQSIVVRDPSALSFVAEWLVCDMWYVMCPPSVLSLCFLCPFPNASVAKAFKADTLGPVLRPNAICVLHVSYPAPSLYPAIISQRSSKWEFPCHCFGINYTRGTLLREAHMEIQLLICLSYSAPSVPKFTQARLRIPRPDTYRRSFLANPSSPPGR